MELKNQVVSLELSKKLKELGVKQESLFYYRLGYHTSEQFDNGVSLGKRGHFDHNYNVEYRPKPRYSTADVKWNEADLQKLNETEISAFTVAELGKMLYGRELPHSMGGSGLWETSEYYDFGGGRYRIEEDTEAEARAKMLIYLLENKLI